MKTLDLTEGSRRGAMKGTGTEGTKPRGSTATKAGTRTMTTTTTAADGAAVVSEPPLEPPRPQGFGQQAARKPKGGRKGPKRR